MTPLPRPADAHESVISSNRMKQLNKESFKIRLTSRNTIPWNYTCNRTLCRFIANNVNNVNNNNNNNNKSIRRGQTSAKANPISILRSFLVQGINHGWKVEEDQGLGLNTGALAPARLAKGQAGCWVREGVAPSRCEGPGVLPPENF